MSPIDWIIMLGTLFGIVAYGVWKTRKVDSVQSYLLGDRDLPWWTIVKVGWGLPNFTSVYRWQWSF